MYVHMQLIDTRCNSTVHVFLPDITHIHEKATQSGFHTSWQLSQVLHAVQDTDAPEEMQIVIYKLKHRF